MKRLAAFSLLAGILALNPGTAQDPKSARPAPDSAKVERASYAVRNADPAILAEVVGLHFRGEATLVAPPTGSGSTVLVSGSPAALAEVLKLLEQLDRKPRTVEVEIVIADLPAAKDGKEPAFDAAAAEALVKDGKGQRIKLTSVEGQQVSTQTGGNKPYVSGTTVFGGGGRGGAGGGGGFPAGGGGGVATKSINYQAVGTTVKMTPRIGSENSVSLELSLQESKVRPPDAGDDSGAVSMENNSLTTRVSVPAGKVVVAQSVRTEGKAGATVSVVVVTARVVDDAPPKPRTK